MVLAASTMSVPAGTVSFLPSIVRLISGIRRNLSDVALMPETVVLVLLAEVADGGVDPPAGRIAEAAQAPAVLQPVRDADQRIELDLRALPGQDAPVGAHRPFAADAAWRALATRLVGVELEQPVRGLHDAVGVVHHDHAARTTHRTRCGQRLHVGLGVEHACREDRSRRAAGPEHLEVAALGHAPGKFHDHVAKGLAELDLVDPRLADVAP